MLLRPNRLVHWGAFTGHAATVVAQNFDHTNGGQNRVEMALRPAPAVLARLLHRLRRVAYDERGQLCHSVISAPFFAKNHNAQVLCSLYYWFFVSYQREMPCSWVRSGFLCAT